jgi:DNA mismatch endonuclease, patch repair protein
MDKFDKSKRSWIMSRIKNKRTKPEIIIRSIIFNLGYRYRVNRRDLPGIPDIVFSKMRKVIFIHGCFWHGHENCSRSKRPTTNQEFWNRKIDNNITRDKRNHHLLKKDGWDALVIWQCQIRNNNISTKIAEFLEN